MSKVYGKITFAEDYNKSFAEFKEDFADNHVFLAIPRDQVDAAYVKAYRIAVPSSKHVPEDVIMIEESTEKKTDLKSLKANGNVPATIEESKKA